MLRATLAKTLAKISVVEKAIRSGDALRDSISRSGADDGPFNALRETAPEPIESRIYDHCAAVTRLYALYEAFVEDAVQTWLQYLEQNSTFALLPSSMQNAYRLGIGRVLANFDRTRYSGLNLRDVVTTYAAALDDSVSYRLLPEAFVFHEANLRIENLIALFATCDIDRVESWFRRDKSLQDLLGNGEAEVTQGLSEAVAQFIDYRNEAAHRAVEVDDLLSADELVRHCKIFAVICTIIADRIVDRILEQMLVSGRAQTAGSVTEAFKNGAVIAKATNGVFAVGIEVYARRDHSCKRLTVVSVQIDDVPYESVTIENDEVEVGLMFDSQPRRGTRLVWVPEPNLVGDKEVQTEDTLVGQHPETESTEVHQAAEFALGSDLLEDGSAVSS